MLSGLRLRSVFLAGCVVLALPGLIACGVYASQAWNAWKGAQTAFHGTKAASAIMRAATSVMAERDRWQQAMLVRNDDADIMLGKAVAATDAAFSFAQRSLELGGLTGALIVRSHDDLMAIRNRARAGTRSALRTAFEQFNRLVESVEDLASQIERKVTLADPSVGIAVGLARNAAEMRGIAARRGAFLNIWLGGQELQQTQKDELLAQNGRLAGAWDRLQRGMHGSGLQSSLLTAISYTEEEFFVEKEPWYRELVSSASAGAERPMSFVKFSTWHEAALERLLPMRDALLNAAAMQARQVIRSAQHQMIASGSVVFVSLLLVAASVLVMLRSVVDPVRGMTKAMTALATGDLAIEIPPSSRLREIGAMGASVAVFRSNIANLQRREAELRQTNLLFTTAIENMSQGLCMYEPDGRLAVVNRRFSEIIGLKSEEVQPGVSFQEVVALATELGYFAGRDVEQVCAERLFQLSQRRLGGHHDEMTATGRVIAAHYEPMLGGGWVATYEDVTERRRSEEQLSFMARHDALTGLANRVRLHESMEALLPRLSRNSTAAVLCLDLDGFKSVNDTLGHPKGDELLRQVAKRLRENTRETDLVSRLGGDEFAVLQADADQPTDAAVLAERLVEVLRVPFVLTGEHCVQIGTSIGVVLADANSTTDELLRSADIALYRAKASGRGSWRFFEQGMDAEMQARRALESDFRRALEEEQFELYYQPLVNAGTQTVTGFEALVRWRHPERGMISPADFIPIAEETGLIRVLGDWVLRRACADAVIWPKQIKVAVNLSSVQFTQGDLVSEVERAVVQAGLQPSRLELEITETILLADNDVTLATLHQLRNLGVRISMDDFGTGYSSLSYLRRFPFDKIKIDQSFVRTLGDQTGSLEIVRAVLGLGKALGIDVLAEGVETEKQLGILQHEGCNELQGYLFGKPKPFLEATKAFAGQFDGHRDRLLEGTS